MMQIFVQVILLNGNSNFWMKTRLGRDIEIMEEKMKELMEGEHQGEISRA